MLLANEKSLEGLFLWLLCVLEDGPALITMAVVLSSIIRVANVTVTGIVREKAGRIKGYG